MKYFSVIVFGAILTMSVISCQGGDGEKKTAKEEAVSEMKAPQHRGHSESVQLNDGERWQANPETNEGIQRMQKMVNAFQPGDSMEAYRQLNAQLMNEYQYIFRECTMKGEAHQQLHNYLLPLKVQFEKLQSKDLKECRGAYETIKTHLDKYSKYFK